MEILDRKVPRVQRRSLERLLAPLLCSSASGRSIQWWKRAPRGHTSRAPRLPPGHQHSSSTSRGPAKPSAQAAGPAVPRGSWHSSSHRVLPAAPRGQSPASSHPRRGSSGCCPLPRPPRTPEITTSLFPWLPWQSCCAVQQLSIH